jgi:hypothetical protein
LSVFSTWLDNIFGPSVTGKKTEITAVVTGVLNLGAQVSCWTGIHCFSDAAVSNMNTGLLTILGLFLANRVARTEAAATAAAISPTQVNVNPTKE